MKQIVTFVGVLLILFVSCSTEEAGKGVVVNSQELSDTSKVILASQEFQASFSDFTRQVSPIFKGKFIPELMMMEL